MLRGRQLKPLNFFLPLPKILGPVGVHRLDFVLPRHELHGWSQEPRHLQAYLERPVPVVKDASSGMQKGIVGDVFQNVFRLAFDDDQTLGIPE